ncbi:unnamed protein product [Lactuca virosa]|uniref:Uncharacterized protein n=1 Tax=Lactuca virosa TaxID=75947 RepID=A0AAU9MRQ2_9ASTR|nr:unnamed protein product [Lactuca virosa]
MVVELCETTGGVGVAVWSEGKGGFHEAPSCFVVEYLEVVEPSLEFVITSKDITNTGAPATLLVFNNEKGFSPKNIESICSVGRSTKKGIRNRGYIVEKAVGCLRRSCRRVGDNRPTTKNCYGSPSHLRTWFSDYLTRLMERFLKRKPSTRIGFKSVFLVTTQPHIFSNGYQIKFNEKPCQQCKVGYIVPEWVDANDPMLSAIKTIYGSATTLLLPTTTLVLPLKPEKVKPVKDQLSSLHPELLLFLSNIIRLSSTDADSYTLHHTTDDDIGGEVERECGYYYYMWKQRFHVKLENKVDVRREVEERIFYWLHQEDVYIQLLLFIAQSWGSCFYKTNMKNTPLIKYVGKDGNVGLVTPVSAGRNKLLAADCDHISWLINWNTEFGCSTGEKLVLFVKAYDIPNLSPPNAAIPTLSSPLTKRNTFLLLAWVRKLKKTSGVGINLPERFLSSIKNGSWLKIYSGGSPGYGPPAGSFMLVSDSTSIGNLVQYASGLVHFPVVDVKFYGDEIKNYKDELETIGVRFEDMDACEFMGKRFMDLAASSKLTKDNVLWMLKLIKYLGGADPRSDLLIKIMRGEKWVRTSQGDMTPGNSALFSKEEWQAAACISNIPFIDEDYYGEEILCFKDELDLLVCM